MALQRFVEPARLDLLEVELDAGLAAGTIAHRDVMEREWSLVRAPLHEVVDYVTVQARLRAGFAEFVLRYDPLILSSSFHETIEPVLARDGISARVRANRALANPNGWRIRWTSDSDCQVCGEPCKRAALPAGGVVFVGDGYSDRCAALAADRVFARSSLAHYLDRRGVPYEPFEDFDQISRALA